ncbi:metallophosphoesterase family protein [Acholeplasma granularum]|uniref:metallophosphoesterase family protein n=1 Tax=Acholeplasma granularum TaxID=264635 RepID=UPI0004ADCEB2|nr:YfcE family phosphodiesterase [Acholeplasma granularum]
MKLLITGDIHGRDDVLQKVLKKEKTFDMHLNTGDIGLDFQTIENSKMIAVKGNTDYYLDLPTERLIEHNGLRILLTHGHLQNVKYGLTELIMMAKEMDANICIFGHTHDPFYRRIDNIIFINPGALTGIKDKTYAIYEDQKVSIINVD